MSAGLTKVLQSKSARNIAANSRFPHQQTFIQFEHPDRDARYVSDYTYLLLITIAERAKVASLKVTSTVRNTHEQAVQMLENLHKPMRYLAPGKAVLALARADLTAGKSPAETLSEMEKLIASLGLRHVTAHAHAAGLNTVDLSITHFGTFDDPPWAYSRMVHALTDGVGRQELSRFGWPEGPKEKAGKLFNDAACLHIEIPQPKLGDFPLPGTARMTA